MRVAQGGLLQGPEVRSPARGQCLLDGSPAGAPVGRHGSHKVGQLQARGPWTGVSAEGEDAGLEGLGKKQQPGQRLKPREPRTHPGIQASTGAGSVSPRTETGTRAPTPEPCTQWLARPPSGGTDH